MKKKFCLIVAMYLIISLQLKAQKSCGTKFNLEIYNQSVQQSQVEGAVQASTVVSEDDVILIPVVVHVVYYFAHQNISTSRINSQINVLNEDFARRNADASNTLPMFLGVADNARIQFVLATRDPSGNPHSGITRTQTSVSGFYDNDLVKSSSTGGVNPWPTNDYLNIWVCNLIDVNGYAQFPWEYAGAPNTDGVVINWQRFGDSSNTAYAGRVATHEAGHWLGVRHIFSDAFPTNCNDNDGISDTPTQKDPYNIANCPSPGANSCGSVDMWMNYMDYSPDACQNLFTMGQADVMRGTLSSGGWRQDFTFYLPSVSTPSGVCTGSSSSLTISNLPPGITATWSISPSSLVNVASGSGTTASVRANNSSSRGTATITFSVNGGTSTGQNATFSEDFWVGKPSNITGTLSGPTTVSVGDLKWYSIPEQGQEDGYYNWTTPLGFNRASGGDGYRNILVWIQSYAQSGYVQVWKTNNCGNGGGKWKYVTVDSGGGCGICPITQMSPNPAFAELKIEFLSRETGKSISDATFEKPREYVITDWEGNQVFQHSSKKTKLELNISRIKAQGVYVLNIKHGNWGTEQLRLIIDR